MQLDTWYQKAMTPFMGVIFSLTVFGCLVIVPLSGKTVPPESFGILTAFAGVVGTRNFFRGKSKLPPKQEGIANGNNP